MIRILMIFVLAISTGFAARASAQTIAVQGEQMWTGTDAGLIDDGVVVFENGKIIAAGPRVSTPIPPGASLLRAKWVTPGLVSAFSQTGLADVSGEDAANDSSASGSDYSAALDAADGFNPDAAAIAVTRLEGFTRIIVGPDPAGNIFAGQGFIADTSGDIDGQPLRRVFAMISLGESGAELAGGSRPAAMAQLRAALDDARNPGRYAGANEGAALNRTDAAALAPAARGLQRMVIKAHRASDLNMIMDFAEANPGLKLIILGADEGWRVAPRLARLGIPVIVDAYSNLPSTFAQLASTSENAARLADAGVSVSIVSFDDPTHQAALARQVAGNAVAAGLSQTDALKALTSAPAAAFGQTGIGVLAPGARADVVAWDGDPIEITSAPQLIYIDGKAQTLTSRQTKLRDRYKNPGKGDRPHAYIKP
jgi:imidazolonepropionase-like amidohydrolase